MKGKDRRLAELKNAIPEVTPEEALALHKQGAVLLDVREADEIANGSPKGALRMGRGFLCQCDIDGSRLSVLVSRTSRAGTNAHGCLFESSAGNCNSRRMDFPQRGTDSVAGRRNRNDHRWSFSRTMMRLVPFDIDATILPSGGVGRESSAVAAARR
mgnify:CR=1 FL=1